MKPFLLLAVFTFCFHLSLYSQEKPTAAPVFEPDPELSITQHKLTLDNGKTLSYTATCGYQILRREDGSSRAKFFFTAYTLDGVTDPAKRPITYTFNGGPGSSSVWLHMGALGPEIIELTEKGDPPPAPYQWKDNPYTWLSHSDMVFIDPVMTGYSRPAKGVDKKEFHGFVEDVESVGAFIHQYTSRYGRWSSPKYLAGESYGTTRACGLAGHLQNRYGMYLNGIILISQITNFQTARFNRGNDLPYPLFLPTYAAVAWYHKKLDPKFSDLQALLREVEQFAMTDYTLALMQGDQLSKEEQEGIASRLAMYTGLSKDYILRSNLRIIIHRFTKELRRGEGITVGRLDGRFESSDYDAVGENYEYDPSYNKTIYGPFSTAINDYLKRELKYNSDLPYEILTGRVQPWNYNNVQNQYLNVAETLRQAISKNPSLKVLICSGYYDLATPYFASQYTMDHLFLKKQLKSNIQFSHYESGHMMYIHQPSLLKMTKDVRQFYDNR